MKKILIIISLFTLISCNHQDRKVHLNFSFEQTKSNIGNDIGVHLAVFDDRLVSGFIGVKEFCDDQKISLTSDQNLAELLKKEIDEQLLRKGFKQGDQKLVEIRIENLKYDAKCGLVIGKSQADILVKVSVTDAKTNINAVKNFELSIQSKHFILPLSSTDDNTINRIISEVVKDILDDDILLRSLAQ